MWFEDEDVTGRRGLGWRRRAVRINVRVGGRRGVAASRTGRVVLLCALAAVTVAAVGMGFRWMLGALFFRNDTYRIAHLDIRGGGELVPYFIREKKGIQEGTNLFACNLRAIRDEFLQQRYSSKYQSLDISRILPDTLRVEVVERVPVARLGRRGGLVVDAEGYAFGIGTTAQQNLPIIYGYAGPALQPGDRIQGALRDAVTVLGAVEETGCGRDLSIAAIDVRGGLTGKRDDMRLILDNETEVWLWWPRRAAKGAGGMDDLRERLLLLRARLLRAKQEGQRLQRVNLTMDSCRSAVTVP
jgi:hypothetical protein